MKKTLIAAAVMAASGVAFAASNVTLYGVVDASVVVGKVKHQDTTVQLKSGFRNGSRWGIKGVEDLGNGYAVGFILEQGYNVDDGTTANGWSKDNSGAFNRESKLYVQGNFGQIGFGRLGSLAGGAQSNNLLTGWALGTSYDGGSWTALAKGNGRLNNAIAYVSPDFAGFKFSAMYSNGTKKDDAKWSDNVHYYGIGGQYTLGGFKNSLIFEAVDNKGQTNSNTAYLINLGLGYNFGAITPMFAYQYNWQKDGVKDNVFGLSALAPLGGGTAKIGARYLFGKNEGTLAANQSDRRRAWTINGAYEYPLSKRTTTYAYAGYNHGSKGLKADITANQTIKLNGYQVGVGMTHNF